MKKNKDGEDEAVIVNSRLDKMSREVLRHPDLAPCVDLSRKRDHFLCACIRFWLSQFDQESANLCLCVYVSMFVCLCVCVFVCLCVYVFVCLCVCVSLCYFACVFVSVCLCLCLCLCE